MNPNTQYCPYLAGDEVLDIIGIVTPRTENFLVNGADFFNFDISADFRGAAFRTCSGCELDYTQQDSGARTVTVTTLTFENTNLRIIYNTPYNGIFYDWDGSLTNLDTNSWATAMWPHNLWDEHCTLQETTHDGLVCDSSV